MRKIEEKVQQAIRDSPMSQVAIAAAVGCSQSFVSAVAKGSNRPGRYYLEFCRVLKLDPATADPLPQEKAKPQRRTIRATIDPPPPDAYRPPVFRDDFPSEIRITQAEYLMIEAHRHTGSEDVGVCIEGVIDMCRAAWIEAGDNEIETRDELRLVGEQLKAIQRNRALRQKVRAGK